MQGDAGEWAGAFGEGLLGAEVPVDAGTEVRPSWRQLFGCRFEWIGVPIGRLQRLHAAV